VRDHENRPGSICRHANGDPGTGFWETVFSVIIEPSAGRMHVSRGTPCQRPYETYVLSPN
jgi:isopenicillin-N N-acyltransferase like protein